MDMYWDVNFYVCSLMTACCGKDIFACGSPRERAIAYNIDIFKKVSACYEMVLGKCGHREVGGHAQMET